MVMAGAREKVELLRLSLESLRSGNKNFILVFYVEIWSTISSPELDELDGVELFLETVEPEYISNQFILFIRYKSEDLLGVEGLCEDEDQHDILVVLPETVQLRLAQLVQLRHRLTKIFWDIFVFSIFDLLKITDLDKF